MARSEKTPRKSKKVKKTAKTKTAKSAAGSSLTVTTKTKPTTQSLRTFRMPSRRAKNGSVGSFVSLALDPRKSQALLQAVKKGLAFSEFEELEASYAVTRGDLAKVLNIPLSTLKRRKDDGFLDVEESDRVMRYARLIASANRMMAGDGRAASEWMKQPQSVFEGETPMEHASTELGAREVEKLIGRISHGVFV